MRNTYREPPRFGVAISAECLPERHFAVPREEIVELTHEDLGCVAGGAIDAFLPVASVATEPGCPPPARPTCSIKVC
jgi:hypothetical protein